jgi:uncharacterized protein (DUF1330 family)
LRGSHYAIGGLNSLNFIPILSHTCACARAHACSWEDIMQGTYKFALVLTAGFMLGAGAIQALHAQAKPPGYLLAEVAVTVDEATYKDSEFMKQTVPSIKATGAKYLAGGFNNATALSGPSAANRIVLLQFETIDKAKAWYADGQAEREKKLGGKVASSFRILAIEGVNQ